MRRNKRPHQVKKMPDILTRMYNRMVFWYKILRGVRGLNAKVQLGLILSAIIDALFHIVHPLPAAKAYVSGIVSFKFRGSWVYFHIRGFSDDLYSIMPGRERDVNDLILSCLKEGDVFIDVGANIGYYSILAGKIVGDDGLVISIEPVSSTANVLNFNVKLNDLNNVKVIRKAAWSNNEVITLHIPKGFYGLASIRDFHNASTFHVEGVPLDALCKAPEVKLIKIDAEGSEYQVLMGARRTLRKTKYVILEASQQKDKIIRLLEEEGFKVRKLKFTTYILAYKV